MRGTLTGRALSRTAATCVAMLSMVVAGFVTATSALAAGPASAHFVGKSVGSYYSPATNVYRSGTPGQTLTYSYQVVNDGDYPAQFRVEFDDCFTLTPLPCQLSDAAFYVGSLQVPGDRFWTPLLEPGKTSAFTVRLTADPAAVQTHNDFFFRLFTAEGVVSLDGAGAEYEIAASGGSKANDLYISQGWQPAIGGDLSGETMASEAIRPGGGASFTVKVQNNTATAADVTLQSSSAFQCYGYTLKVTAGFTDVTAAVKAGKYTLHLNPGASRSLTFLVKYVTLSNCSSYGEIYTVFASVGPTIDPLHYADNSMAVPEQAGL